MIELRKYFYGSKKYYCLLLILLAVWLTPDDVLSQERSKYIRGENNLLVMDVHIIGEVKRPGKYRVRDNTNLIEILAEAGGPTEFSNLSTVTVTNVEMESGQDGTSNLSRKRNPRIAKYNVENYLEKNNVPPPPVLKPGDVVLVPKNKWRTWKDIAAIIRDVSVVGSAYFLYLRATKD